MSLTNFPPQSKVPGHVNNVKEHALNKDLTKLSKRELLDLRNRQFKLLENKFVENFGCYCAPFNNFVVSVSDQDL